jgi:hypothetical protein
MYSLNTGVWGGFTGPRSRALGGKSGMTRAEPLVCFSPPNTDIARITLLCACLVLWCALVSSLPPTSQPSFMGFDQDDKACSKPFDPTLLTATAQANARCTSARLIHVWRHAGREPDAASAPTR